ncbi:MAG: DNA starvation/stationary phase protection protein Dps [Pirellulaceae bacterium]
MHPTRIDLPLATREKVCALLNQNLADTIDLSGQAKQAHWNVKGVNFIALHELFDKVHEVAEGAVDELAERITALGGTAEGTVQVVAKRSRLAPYPTNIVRWRDHVQKMSDALASVGKNVRAAIDESDKLGDKDTADLFTEISRDVDKQLWFVEAHIQVDE